MIQSGLAHQQTVQLENRVWLKVHLDLAINQPLQGLEFSTGVPVVHSLE